MFEVKLSFLHRLFLISAFAEVRRSFLAGNVLVYGALVVMELGGKYFMECNDGAR